MSHNLARCDHLDSFPSTYSLLSFSQQEQSILYHVVDVQSNPVTILVGAMLLVMTRAEVFQSFGCLQYNTTQLMFIQ